MRKKSKEKRYEKGKKTQEREKIEVPKEKVRKMGKEWFQIISFFGTDMDFFFKKISLSFSKQVPAISVLEFYVPKVKLLTTLKYLITASEWQVLFEWDQLHWK